MKLSYVLITRNRRDRLLATLQYLARHTPMPEGTWEAVVVDNGSDDDTATAVRREAPWAALVHLPENEGMPARNHGVAIAAGRYIAFLDDDSYPVGDTIPLALSYLSHHPRTAALVGRVVLPSGGLEGPAFPAVTLGGASIVRKAVLDAVGGFAPEFFRQAEEYDLSFRIWQAGHRIERFEDLTFRHDKQSTGRSSAMTHKMDVRNNLILVERYLPREMRAVYRADWLRRYGSIALHEGHADALNAALREARVWARREAAVGRRTLGPNALERLFEYDRQAAAVAAWAEHHAIRRVIIADYSKNVFATYRACRHAGLNVVAMADNRAALEDRAYRRAPILPDNAAATVAADGVVLSTINPAQVESRLSQLRAVFKVPVLRLWQPRYLTEAPAAAA